MKEINALEITKVVKKLCIEANYYLPKDIKDKLLHSLKNEESDMAKDILEKILLNADIACKEDMPICQDTGMACIFVEVGQDVHIIGSLEKSNK